MSSIPVQNQAVDSNPSQKTQPEAAEVCIMPGRSEFTNLPSISPDFEPMIIQNTWAKNFFKFNDD